MSQPQSSIYGNQSDISQNSNYSDRFTGEFVAALVLLVTGVEVEKIPVEAREEIISEVLDIYFEFMESFIRGTQGQRTGIQYKIFAANHDLNMLSQFQDLDEGLKQAHEEFINYIISN